MESINPTNQTSKSHLRTIAPVFVVLAAVFWGILVVFVRAFGQAEFKSMEIVTLRVYSSAIFSWIFLIIFDRKSNRDKNSSKTYFRLRDSWCFVGTGLVSIVFFSYCYFRNVEVSSAAVAAILMYTSPIFVTLLSAVFFKEKLTKLKLTALLLAIIGCAMVSGIAGGISDVSPIGILLGLGSGIGYALYSIFGRFALNKGYSPFMVTAMTFTFACVGVLPFINIMGLYERLVTEPQYILLALLMGLIGSCTPFALYTLGLRYMEASKAAILATLEPIVTALVGTFFYKEPIDIYVIAGIVMVLVAGILCSASPGKQK
ncbi:MAG: EamA family transporter [Lachnospiraceae bacterium]|nr:EamA family transporter [Lachnospiraceae bacterium]